ncbi:MAG: bis(5'-nucleosyl)-tetraphosphatase (symmetrical) YqeK [Oscillospiraceae bacterium]|nr:bis(5'-nucleosyl)-tetraphosphatase (symmetrical) YqeK [Oscillospiraceae bacterium]
METVEQVKARLEQMLKPGRLAHSYGVAKEARRLASRYGADPERAYYAGLCHDICKNMPMEEQLQWIKRSAIILDDAFWRQPPIWHGFAAAQYIKEQMGVETEDILQSVRYHTTGRANMSLLEKIIFTADLTEQGRDYPDVETVRTLADQSLDQAMLYILRYTLEKLLVDGGPICRDSWEAYNQLILVQTSKKSLKKE